LYEELNADDDDVNVTPEVSDTNNFIPIHPPFDGTAKKQWTFNRTTKSVFFRRVSSLYDDVFTASATVPLTTISKTVL